MRFRERMARVTPTGDPEYDDAYIRLIALAWYILHAQFDCDEEYARTLIHQYGSSCTGSQDNERLWLIHDGPVVAAAETYGLLHLKLDGADYINWKHKNQHVDRFKPVVQDYIARHDHPRDDEDDD